MMYEEGSEEIGEGWTGSGTVISEPLEKVKCDA